MMIHGSDEYTGFKHSMQKMRIIAESKSSNIPWLCEAKEAKIEFFAIAIINICSG